MINQYRFLEFEHQSSTTAVSCAYPHRQQPGRPVYWNLRDHGAVDLGIIVHDQTVHKLCWIRCASDAHVWIQSFDWAVKAVLCFLFGTPLPEFVLAARVRCD